jgi:glycosyltransferase involved in cell wall biosynthesis
MKHIISYLPHGIDSKKFYPIHNADDKDFEKFKSDIFNGVDYEFVVLFNSRNIRRKQPSDVMLGYSHFVECLKANGKTKTLLIMKTHIQDPNGTDLMAVKQNLFPELDIIFIENVLSDQYMNYLYNISDVTVSMSSAEGFGLSIAESIMAGTMVIAPVHGGLQDQMNFYYRESDGQPYKKWYPSEDIPSNSHGQLRNHGIWSVPLYPSARQLQGSIPTPYIFDYAVDASDLGKALLNVFNMSKQERIENGLEGRKWMLSDESGMNLNSMSNKFKESVNKLFETWKPRPKYTIEKINYKTDKKSFKGLIN